MCNPRRVVVRLAETVRQAWQRTIEAHVTEQTEIRAHATLETQIDLAAELGDIALQELLRLLGEGFGGWYADGDTFTLPLEHGISLHYVPAGRRLEVRAQLSETVQAAATSRGTYSGTLDTQVEVEGVGRYYDDDWGGHTEARAREAAERAARVRLEAERERLVTAAAREQAEAQARSEAQARLREERERRQAALDERLEVLLRESEAQVQATIGALLGQTYRRAIIRLVHENGGQVIQDSAQGAMIDLVARI